MLDGDIPINAQVPSGNTVGAAENMDIAAAICGTESDLSLIERMLQPAPREASCTFGLKVRVTWARRSRSRNLEERTWFQH
jgi:hypothetical protein